MALRSLWLDEALAGEEDAPRLEGEERADVCVVGGGYTGLWTALRLKELDPAVDVTLVEADVCGGGPSGRNGGFVLSWWAKFTKLEHLCGAEEAVRLARASADAVAAVGEFCSEHGVDAHYRYDGWLWAATSAAQAGAWDETRPGDRAPRRRGVRPSRPGGGGAAGRLADPPRGRARADRGDRAAGPARARAAPGRARAGRPRVRALADDAAPSARGRCASTPPAGSVTAERVVLALNAWLVQVPELVAIAVRDRERHGRDRRRFRSASPRSADGRDRDLRLPPARQLLPHDARRAGRARRRAAGRSPGAEGSPAASTATSPAPGRARPAASTGCTRRSPTCRCRRSWTGPIDRSLDGLPFFGRLPGVPTSSSARATRVTASGRATSAVGCSPRSCSSATTSGRTRRGLAHGPHGGVPPSPSATSAVASSARRWRARNVPTTRGAEPARSRAGSPRWRLPGSSRSSTGTDEVEAAP